MAVNKTLLLTRDLTIHFGGITALDRVDIACKPGEIVGVLGPNGAGKTTTMKMIYGLAHVDDGELRVLGLDARKQRRQVKARLGVVPQEANLDWDLTVRENLVQQALYFGSRADGRIDELLELAQLSQRGESKPRELSGGMQKRLLIARALINDPQLIVLDEPTTGLDPQARHLIWERLRRLTQEGKTLVLTTHFMEEAERICDRLAIMDHGKIVESGSPAELLERFGQPNLEGVFIEITGRGLRE